MPSRDAANVYLVKTSDERTYVEPVMDDGSGPSWSYWPMAPVVAESPGKAKTLFLRAFTQRGRCRNNEGPPKRAFSPNRRDQQSRSLQVPGNQPGQLLL